MWTETPLGYEFRQNNILTFFGKKGCTLDLLKKSYSSLDFRQVRQTHSDICVLSDANNQNIEADAHYTNENNVALLIKTADCLPLLIHADDSVMAIHAGWRGVANQITLKSLTQLQFKSIHSVWIGPHILSQSFEVDEPVKQQLLASALGDLPGVYRQLGAKYYVDLQKIIDSQFQPFHPLTTHKINLDTYKNPSFNSYRTDQTAQRNLSFIAKMQP